MTLSARLVGGACACAWVGVVLEGGGGQGATVIYCAPVGPCIMEEEYEEDNETI